MVNIMENPIEIHDLGVPLFLEHPNGNGMDSSHHFVKVADLFPLDIFGNNPPQMVLTGI